MLARVDDRLIHGQVVVGWARFLEADCLVVANDTAAADPMQRSLLPLAVPPHIEVGIYHVAEAALQLASGRYDHKRVILLFATLADALGFVRAGGLLERLNIGGVRFAPGKIQVKVAVALGSDDLAAARQLHERGIELTMRMVPGEPEEPLIPALEALSQ